MKINKKLKNKMQMKTEYNSKFNRKDIKNINRFNQIKHITNISRSTAFSVLTLIFFSLLIIFSINLVSSHGEETFSQAEEIIKQKISCDNLTSEQLEILGDYYMEQMHPGELHEIMDERMGGEGSESLKAVHINMGLAFYCGEHDNFSMPMMNMMMGRNMMGNYYSDNDRMMQNPYYENSRTGLNIINLILTLLVIIVLVITITLLIKKAQTKKPRRKK